MRGVKTGSIRGPYNKGDRKGEPMSFPVLRTETNKDMFYVYLEDAVHSVTDAFLNGESIESLAKRLQRKVEKMGYKYSGPLRRQSQ